MTRSCATRWGAPASRRLRSTRGSGGSTRSSCSSRASRRPGGWPSLVSWHRAIRRRSALQVLGDVRRLAVEHPEAEREDEHHERDRLEQGEPASHDLSRAERRVVDHRVAELLEDRDEWIERVDVAEDGIEMSVAEFGAYRFGREDHGRCVEEDLRDNFPDRRDVAKANEQRR